MNFLSHFHLDREINNAPFVVGVCTPDLISLYNREIRIKHPPVLPSHHADYQYFVDGILRHYEADKVFHNSPFFAEEMKKIESFLKENFADIKVKRPFFVAHVLVELMIDKVLIAKDEKLIPDFYENFHQVGHTQIATLTQIATAKEIDAYPLFIQKFLQNQYLYHYADYEYILYVLQRIVRRVGIIEVEYLKSDILQYFLQDYEKELATNIHSLFDYMDTQMKVMSIKSI